MAQEVLGEDAEELGVVLEADDRVRDGDARVAASNEALVLDLSVHKDQTGLIYDIL